MKKKLLSYIEQLQMVIVNKVNLYSQKKNSSLLYEKFLSIYFLWSWGKVIIMLIKFDILLWGQNIVKM